MQTCRGCGEQGDVRIVKASRIHKEVTVLDHIPHKEGCPNIPKVPARHFERRGWVKHEKDASARMGIRGTLASGAVGMDGDARALQRWRLECKQTASDRYVLTQATWTKLTYGALSVGEEPVFNVEFLLPRGQKYRIVVMRCDLWNSYHQPVLGGETASRWHLRHVNMTPCFVGLTPPGVMAQESDFLAIQRQVDAELSGSNL